MKKFWIQVLFNLAIFFGSILAIWFSNTVKILDWASFEDCLTADLIFTLITTLAGLQGVRLIEGYAGLKFFNCISGAIQVAFLVVYGVAIPLQGEDLIVSIIGFCLWLFLLGILIEYGTTFWYTLKASKNPNSIAASERYKNDKH